MTTPRAASPGRLHIQPRERVIPMTSMAVLTPSYGPDVDLCWDLHDSVLAHAPEHVQHHIVVPKRDLAAFRRFQDGRTVLHTESEILPRSFLPLPWVNFSINARRPFPPVR